MNSACLVFHCDESYIEGLKVLLYTLKRSPRLSKLPKVIITDSILVANEFSSVSDVAIHVLSEVQLDALDNIELSFDRPLPRVLENKTRFITNRRKTFQKLYAFSDFGFERNIFLDSDLINLNNADQLLDECGKEDFYAAPALLKSMIFEASGELKSSDDLNDFHKSHFNNHMVRPNFNSGVFVANKTLIGAASVQRIISTAQSGCFTGDQPILNKYLADGGYSFGSLLPWFNVERPFYAAFGEDQYNRDLSSIRFLHFTGQKKPWWPYKSSDNEVRDVNFLYRTWDENCSAMLADRAVRFIST